MLGTWKDDYQLILKKADAATLSQWFEALFINIYEEDEAEYEEYLCTLDRAFENIVLMNNQFPVIQLTEDECEILEKCLMGIWEHVIYKFEHPDELEIQLKELEAEYNLTLDKFNSLHERFYKAWKPNKIV